MADLPYYPEYPYYCECGEMHSTFESAAHCRKCLKYLDRFSRFVHYEPEHGDVRELDGVTGAELSRKKIGN